MSASPLLALESRVTGRIVKITDSMVFIDAGINKGLQPGDRFEVLRQDLNGAISNIGILSVTQIFEKTSVAVPLLLVSGMALDVNDMIFEYRDFPSVAAPVPGISRPVIRSKWIHASEDNIDVVIVADVESRSPVFRVYCMYRFNDKSPWQGMALNQIEEGGSQYSGIIPNSELTEGKIEYYIIAVDSSDLIAYSGSTEYPHQALISIAEPYYTDQAEAGIAHGTESSGHGISGWLFIPGAYQIKKGNTLMGLSLLGLETAALAAGITAGTEQAVYYGVAGLVYVFNLADGLLTP